MDNSEKEVKAMADIINTCRSQLDTVGDGIVVLMQVLIILIRSSKEEKPPETYNASVEDILNILKRKLMED